MENEWITMICLVVKTYPSEKWWSEFVSWDDGLFMNIHDYSQLITESHNPFHGSIIDYYIPLYPIISH